MLQDSDFDPDKSEAGEDAHPRATVSGHKRSLANGTQASHADEDEGASEDIEDEVQPGHAPAVTHFRTSLHWQQHAGQVAAALCIASML